MSEAAAQGGLARLLSDDRLTRRAVEGDQRAFAAIFRRYHQPLFRFCMAIVGNPEDAQDALQNTMIKVMRALPGEERQIELKPWLYRIAHNESIDLLRRRRESRQLDVEQAAPGGGLAEDAATRERLRRLLADLRELPERQREVLVMREMGGLDFEEIGAALATSGAVARQTLYEARQSLHQMEEGREMSCDRVTVALSDGDGRVMRRRDVRAHLRACASCRRFRDEIKARERDFAAFSPLPAVAAAGMLHGLIGGHGAGAGTGGGLAATVGGGAAKGLGASAAVKGLATAAVVAAIGVTAADRSGVIHLGLPGDRGAQSSGSEAPGGSGAGAAGGESGGSRNRAHGGGQGAGSAGAAGAAGRAGSGAGSTGAAAPAASAPGKGHSHGQAQAPGSSKAEGPAETHPGGRGHEQQHPEAAGNGQETAAGHKPEAKPEQAVEGGGGSRPTRPEHTAPETAPEAVPTDPPPAPKEPPESPAGAPEFSPQSEAAPATDPSEGSGPSKAAEKKH
jgi:RNA polymerase sigma factor (sigma-70 family)